MLSDRWLTFRELMAYLKIGRSKLYKLLQEGTIPASRIGKSWRIDREEVDAWMKTQRAIPTRDDLEGEPPLEPEVLELHSKAGSASLPAKPGTE
ncbi:MAG TPA: helix-turn-helix domain-containing protein [Kiritimatiellia bacterium]|nr:helix-turn-helix domain-containing protein [Kiritimatiellia bacterium]HQQ04013.1 helix-turn-helix domain-containing protein [Kiritimatiellia bacterium]